VEQKKALQSAYRKYFIAADTKEPCSFYAGALDTIAWLRHQGHQTAIATGKSRSGLDRVLASSGQGGLFDGSRCADETASKPDPMMVNELLQEFSLGPDEALMIGDTDYDLQMATAAGVNSIGLSHGAHSIERLKNAQPLCICGSYKELGSWLAQHIGAADKTR